MSIGRKIGLPIVLMTAGGLVAYASFYWYLLLTRSDIRFIELAATEAVAAEQVGRLAYSLVQDFDWARDPLEDAVSRFDAGLARLRGEELEEGAPTLDPLADALRASVVRVDEAWRPVRELSLGIARLPLGDAGAEDLYMRMRPLLPELDAATQALVSDARSRSELLRLRMRFTLGAICGADLALMILGLWLIRRRVLRPLKIVEEAALRVKEGDFSESVPVLAQDELGRLATAFNEMASSLRQLLEREGRVKRSLRSLSGKLLRAQDEERRRIARELHDSTVQTIAAASLRLGDLDAEALSESEGEALTATRELLGQASEELRTLSYLLHPPLLEGLGFAAALEDYVKGFSARTKIDVTLELAGDAARLDDDSELALFRVVQECLANVQRHADSVAAKVTVRRDGECVVLLVEDSGKGIPEGDLERVVNGHGGGVGVGGMRERVALLGGEFDLASDAAGTRVSVRLPLPPPPGAATGPRGES